MTLDLNDPFEFWVAQNFLDITETELKSKREAWVAGVAAERKRCAEICTKRMEADSDQTHPIRTTQWLEAQNIRLELHLKDRPC